MFGGTLTLIGTSTNVLASDVAAWLAAAPEYTNTDLHELGMFEFTGFGVGDCLTEVTVREDSPLVGRKVREALVDADFDVDLLQLIRGEEVFLEPLGPKQIQAGDTFAIRTDRDTLLSLLDVEGWTSSTCQSTRPNSNRPSRGRTSSRSSSPPAPRWSASP